MATANLTTSPTTLAAAGTAGSITIRNTGVTEVTYTVGGQRDSIRPGRSYDGVALGLVQAWVTAQDGGTGSVFYETTGVGSSTSLVTASELAADVAPAIAASSSMTNTYGPLGRSQHRRSPIPVASDCFAGHYTAKVAAGTSRCAHRIAVTCRDLRLVYANHQTFDTPTVGLDTDGPSVYTVNASVEIAGVIYRVTFNGQVTATIDPGGMIVSDPLGVSIAAQTVIYSRTYVSAAGGTFYAAIAAYGSNGGFTTTTDLTAPGSGSIADGTTWLYAPSVILGTPTADDTPGLGAVGDSISIGYGSSTSGPAGSAGGGWLSRGAYGKLGAVIVGHSGEKSSLFTRTSHYRRLPALQWCTHIVCGHGANDVYAGDALATIQANLIAEWGILRASQARILQVTITPKTSSTDSWATTANQTISSAPQNAVRIALNNWIRAGAPISAGVAVAVGTSGALLAGSAGHQLSGYVEVADYAESARDSGIWKAGFTDDGLHPNQTGTHATTGMGQAVTLPSFTFAAEA